jgi:hypothetical protein
VIIKKQSNLALGRSKDEQRVKQNQKISELSSKLHEKDSVISQLEIENLELKARLQINNFHVKRLVKISYLLGNQETLSINSIPQKDIDEVSNFLN